MRERAYSVPINTWFDTKPQDAQRKHATTLKRVLAFLRIIQPRGLCVSLNGQFPPSVMQVVAAVDATRVANLRYEDPHYWEDPSQERKSLLQNLLVQCAERLDTLHYRDIHPMNEAVLTDAEYADLLPASFPRLVEITCGSWFMRNWDDRLRPEGGQRRVRLTEAVLERAPNLETIESAGVRCGYNMFEEPPPDDRESTVCELTQRFFKRHLALQEGVSGNVSKLWSIILESTETGWPAVGGELHPIQSFPELAQLTNEIDMEVQSLYEPNFEGLPPNLEILRLGKFETYEDAAGRDITPSLDSLRALLVKDSKWMPRLERLMIEFESDLRRTGAWNWLCQLCDERGVKLEIVHLEGEEEEDDGSDEDEE